MLAVAERTALEVIDAGDGDAVNATIALSAAGEATGVQRLPTVIRGFAVTPRLFRRYFARVNTYV